MTFYEKYTDFCRKKGETPNGVAIACGLSNATATHWAQGAVPRMSTAIKLAEYLGISVVDLVPDAESKEKPALPKQDGRDPEDEELDSLLPRLTRDQKRMLVAQLRVLAGESE